MKTGDSAQLSEKIEVSVESDMLDLVKWYLDERKKLLPELESAMDGKNWPELESIGHQFLGNARTYGFSDLSELGRALEDASKARNETDARSAVQQICLYIQRVVIVSS